MRFLFLIVFFLTVSVSCLGQKSKGYDSLFYFQFYKINTNTKTINSSTKNYKVFGNHDGIYFKPFNFLLWFYKSVISEQLLSDCGFVPSCSRFSYQAIHDLGLIKGIFLTADRLTRCNGFANVETSPYLIDYKYAKVKDSPSFYRFTK